MTSQLNIRKPSQEHILYSQNKQNSTVILRQQLPPLPFLRNSPSPDKRLPAIEDNKSISAVKRKKPEVPEVRSKSVPKFLSQQRTINHYGRLCDQPFLDLSKFHWEQVVGAKPQGRNVRLAPIRPETTNKEILSHNNTMIENIEMVKEKRPKTEFMNLLDENEDFGGRMEGKRKEDFTIVQKKLHGNSREKEANEYRKKENDLNSKFLKEKEKMEEKQKRKEEEKNEKKDRKEEINNKGKDMSNRNEDEIHYDSEDAEKSKDKKIKKKKSKENQEGGIEKSTDEDAKKKVKHEEKKKKVSGEELLKDESKEKKKKDNEKSFESDRSDSEKDEKKKKKKEKKDKEKKKENEEGSEKEKKGENSDEEKKKKKKKEKKSDEQQEDSEEEKKDKKKKDKEKKKENEEGSEKEKKDENSDEEKKKKKKEKKDKEKKKENEEGSRKEKKDEDSDDEKKKKKKKKEKKSDEQQEDSEDEKKDQKKKKKDKEKKKENEEGSEKEKKDENSEEEKQKKEKKKKKEKKESAELEEGSNENKKEKKDSYDIKVYSLRNEEDKIAFPKQLTLAKKMFKIGDQDAVAHVFTLKMILNPPINRDEPVYGIAISAKQAKKLCKYDYDKVVSGILESLKYENWNLSCNLDKKSLKEAGGDLKFSVLDKQEDFEITINNLKYSGTVSLPYLEILIPITNSKEKISLTPKQFKALIKENFENLEEYTSQSKLAQDLNK